MYKRILFFAILLCLFHGNTLRADGVEKHREVLQSVFDRLMAIMPTPEGWEVWPPVLKLEESEVVNAFASFERKDQLEYPRVTVTTSLIEKVAQFDPDVLALTVGHELGHLFHRHTHTRDALRETVGGNYPITILANSRDDEFEADLFGMRLAVSAGFSHKAVMQDIQGMRKEMGSYCRFEGLSASHPSWEERGSYLAETEQQRSLWRSLSSFQTGVMFLENHQYAHARLCFKNVVAEFPECYEGWANLGYALLMQYCDALDTDDLRRMDVGHLVVGGFYRRPDSLEPTTRGIDEELWFEAVGAFREALRLRDRLQIEDPMVMTKANLAVAYLIHPNGKDVEQSERWFEEVFASLKGDKSKTNLDPLVHATILINFGSARNLDDQQMKETLALIANVKTKRKNTFAIKSLEAAVAFNQAKALQASGDADKAISAIALLEKYLDNMTPASSWWTIAYEQYRKLAQAANQKVRSEDDFQKLQVTDWRPLTSVTLPSGQLIGLSDRMTDVVSQLGEADAIVPVISGTNLKQYHYAKLGITVVATREVLSIILDSDQSPQVTLQRPGLGGDTTVVSIGMDRDVLETLVGSEWDCEIGGLFGPDKIYQYYRKLGLAVLFKNQVICEIVVTSVPLSSTAK